ncbi:PrpF domain-containing protein [Telmatospirillum siberiense]|uniref:PrpF protein n=1 Tax=Telmatospirillum siberiense TaxID=382514 RepID=A0A2N3PT44_9PROT|nr:PrpF domain-containing protein [Telmatospirillum siberiense]PKU23575.1 PrpF protein [Telmatospirillum siberiense]
MVLPTLPGLPGFQIRTDSGVVEFPVHHMRGGTSTGLAIWERLAPSDPALREELLRHLMGVPLEGDRRGNRQITGLGRGTATSNKVFFVDTETADGRTRLVSTLAQLAADHAAIDWSVNCGNMSAALPLWALDCGLAGWTEGSLEIDIRNTNTGVVTTGRMARDARGLFVAAEIPGVDGAFPSVDLFLHDPVGSKTGRLLPTGQICDRVAGHTVSCVDVAVPMVIADAAEFGKTALEPIAELEGDKVFMEALRAVWVEAGLLMGLKRRDGQPMTTDDLARSETIPKVCIVAPAAAGGSIAVRYFTPQTAHASMAVSGGCCLAAAALIQGSVASRMVRGLPAIGPDFTETVVGIENPAGVLEATVVARAAKDGLEVRSAAYRRSAQVLLRGQVPLYRASEALKKALLANASNDGTA